MDGKREGDRKKKSGSTETTGGDRGRPKDIEDFVRESRNAQKLEDLSSAADDFTKALSEDFTVEQKQKKVKVRKPSKEPATATEEMPFFEDPYLFADLHPKMEIPLSELCEPMIFITVVVLTSITALFGILSIFSIGYGY